MRGLDLARVTSYAGDFAAAGRISLEALHRLGNLEAPITAALEGELFTLGLNEYTPVLGRPGAPQIISAARSYCQRSIGASRTWRSSVAAFHAPVQ